MKKFWFSLIGAAVCFASCNDSKATLNDSIWKVSSIHSGEVDFTADELNQSFSENLPYISFANKNKCSAFTGINLFNCDYAFSEKNKTLSFSSGAVTLALGPEENNFLEEIFMRCLKNTVYYDINGDNLNFLGINREIIMELKRK